MMVYRTKRQVSSGGVIVRQHRADAQVCLIARSRDGQLVWGLPKGHVEADEDPQATAVREVREETGLLGEPVAKLGTISYWFAMKPACHDKRGAGRQDGIRYFKTVHFYLLRYVEGTTSAHDHEVEDAVWLSIDDAIKGVSYENERQILLRAQRHLKKVTS